MKLKDLIIKKTMIQEIKKNFIKCFNKFLFFINHKIIFFLYYIYINLKYNFILKSCVLRNHSVFIYVNFYNT